MAKPLYGIYGASGCGRGIMPLAREWVLKQGISLDRLVFIDDGIQNPESRIQNLDGFYFIRNLWLRQAQPPQQAQPSELEVKSQVAEPVEAAELEGKSKVAEPVEAPVFGAEL